MSKRSKPNTADTFSVWGAPPYAVMNALSVESQKKLKRYVDGVVKHCYRIAYDGGYAAGARDEYEAMKAYIETHRGG